MKTNPLYILLVVLTPFIVFILGVKVIGSPLKEQAKVMCGGQTCDKVLEDSAKCMDQLDRCREECK